VGPPDFKSGVPSDEGGRWVRFPCTSANLFQEARDKPQQQFDPPAWRPPLKGAAALVTIKQLARQA